MHAMTSGCPHARIECGVLLNILMTSILDQSHIGETMLLIHWLFQLVPLSRWKNQD